MTKSQMFKKAHAITKELVARYSVSYKVQFGISLKFVYENKGVVKMDLKMKTLEISKNALTLRSWAVSNMTDKETLSFFLEEDLDEETKITVSRKGSYFTVMLGTEILGKVENIELFEDFRSLLGVESLKDLPVYSVKIS